jgi:hypothetical protein
MKEDTLVYVLFALPLGVSLGLWCFNSRAERRARQLLQAVLTQEQYRHLLQRGYLDIRSPSHQERFYRVPKAPGRVHLIENEQLQTDLCLQPLDWVPNADFLVIHKLMIEADEETYLQKANRFVPVHTSRRIV